MDKRSMGPMEGVEFGLVVLALLIVLLAWMHGPGWIVIVAVVLALVAVLSQEQRLRASR